MIWPLVAAFFIAPAQGHDYVDRSGARTDANWIMDNPETAWCCGPTDCYPVTGRVYLTPQGWRVKGLKGAVPVDKTYPSKRPGPWACQTGSLTILRCLFLPGAGG